MVRRRAASSAEEERAPIGTHEEELTPNQRAGLTKRQRTRNKVIAATEELLQDRPYDALRVADIAQRAGVGTATVHQIFGHKAAVVGEIFTRLCANEVEDARTAWLSRSVAPDELLNRYLRRIADVAGSNPRVASAYLRAYASEVLQNPGAPDELLRLAEPLRLSQSIIDSGRITNRLPEGFFSSGAVGEPLTFLLLSLVVNASPDTRDKVVDGVLSFLLPRNSSLSGTGTGEG